MKNLTGEQLTAAVTTLAIAIAQGKASSELTILGDIFTQLGAVLFVIADKNDT